MRLDFLIPGFAKCGNTTLCTLLGEHPEIFMPKVKDFRLFDRKYSVSPSLRVKSTGHTRKNNV